MPKPHLKSIGKKNTTLLEENYQNAPDRFKERFPSVSEEEYGDSKNFLESWLFVAGAQVEIQFLGSGINGESEGETPSLLLMSQEVFIYH